MSTVLANSLEILKQIRAQLSNPKSFKCHKTNSSEDHFRKSPKKTFSSKMGKIYENKKSRQKFQGYISSSLEQKHESAQVLNSIPQDSVIDESVIAIGRLKQALLQFQKQTQESLQTAIKGYQQQIQYLSNDPKKSKFGGIFETIQSKMSI